MKSFETDNFIFVDFTEMDEAMSAKVWECRNHPLVRKNMVNSNLITLEEHNNFLNYLKNNDNKKYYYVTGKKEGGNFIGSINIIYESQNTVERGIYLHPDYFGRGISKKLTIEFYNYLHSNLGISTIKTKVKKNNIPSNKLDKSLGAEIIGEDEEYLYWSVKL